MHTELDALLIPQVLEIVARYGKSVTFSVPPDRSYDVETGTVEADDPVVYTAVITPPSPCKKAYAGTAIARMGGTAAVQGQTTGQQSDCMAYLPASGLAFTPAIGLVMTMDGQQWSVMSVGSIYSGEQVCLYELTFSRT